MPAIGAIGRALTKGARMGPGMFIGGGAAAGGIYGAFSDDTSVIGGALGGAMLGAMAYGGARFGGRGMQVYSKMGAMGASRGRALGAVVDDLGRQSKRFFGAGLQSNAAVNPITSSVKATKGLTFEESIARGQRRARAIERRGRMRRARSTREANNVQAIYGGLPGQGAQNFTSEAARSRAYMGQISREVLNPANTFRGTTARASAPFNREEFLASRW